MKTYKTKEIKNIALLGSKGSGKTTLAESMLFECGVIKRRGTVESKTTVSDYFPVEKEYGSSVFSTVFYAEFNGKKLNVVDCPGADDFVGNAITALNVTDTGLIVVNAQYGVEVGTQNIFRTATSLKSPSFSHSTNSTVKKPTMRMCSNKCARNLRPESRSRTISSHAALASTP